MKNLILILVSALTLSACAPASKDDAPASSALPAPTPAPQTVCASYDSCTYGGGLFPQPIYNCVSKTFEAADHPEISASYFKGESCLTYREDFHSQQSWCGPMNQFPCTIEVQGPGPLAIPALNL